MELKVARIGNSRGVRLPADILRRYRIGAVVLMEERAEGIFLHPSGPVDHKLSWADTADEMARSRENWSDWDGTAGDGLDGVTWKSSHSVVAEGQASYGAKSNKRGKSKRGGTK